MGECDAFPFALQPALLLSLRDLGITGQLSNASILNSIMGTKTRGLIHSCEGRHAKTVSNTESRTNQILQRFEEVVSEGSLNKQEIAKMKARLTFPEGHVLGRCCCAFFNSLTERLFRRPAD